MAEILPLPACSTLVEAYAQAHEVVSDLSAIFETLENLDLSDLRNERIARMLSCAGCRHTADRLKVISHS